MLYKESLPKKYKKLQRNRVYHNYNYYNIINYNKHSVISLSNSMIFLAHLKLINLTLKKNITKKKRLTRKERFKKGQETQKLTRRMSKKPELYRFNFRESSFYTYLPKEKRQYFKKVKLKQYKRLKTNFICFNLPKLPYVRKSLGVRMGKGKGQVKKWGIVLKAGFPVISLFNWKHFKAMYLLKLIRHFLPGNFHICVPRKNNQLQNHVFSI